MSAARGDGVVLYDLEFTAWEGSEGRDWSGPDEFREIIQIGAVRVVPGNGFAEAGRFGRIVAPWLHAELSDYIVTLTGITPDHVSREGVPFEQAYSDFQAFTAGAHCYSFGTDYKILCENCGLNRISAPPTHRFHNLRPYLARLAPGSEAVSSGDLPAFLGLDVEGTRHSAEADAVALARALRELYSREVLAALPGDLGA